MNRIVFLLVALTFFACQEKKEKVIDMRDITPHSTRVDDGKSKVDKKETVDYGFDIMIGDSVGIAVMEIDSIIEPLFPDRFTPRNKKKLTLQLKENPIIFCQWTFKDSTRTKNALYNWIDCFGPNCKSIKYGQKVNFQKDNFILLENDTSLTYISSPIKLDVDDWLKYFELKSNIKDWKLLLYQGTRTKATWYKVVEGKKELILVK